MRTRSYAPRAQMTGMRAIVLAVVLLIMPWHGRLFAQPVAPAIMPAFSAKDQFERLLTREGLAGLRVIFIVAAREGAGAAQRWAEPLRDPASARGVRVVNVADLVGAPRLLRGLIRRGFPKDSSQSVLLDFDGTLGRALPGPRPPIVAVAYGADGRLRSAEELPIASADQATADRRIAATERR